MRKTILRLLALVVILICTTGAYAADQTSATDQWTKQDTIKEATFIGLLCLEKAQRNYVADHGGMYVPNPFLGPNRKESDVDKFLIASAILHPVISYLLPRQYRDWWQYGTLIIEGTSIASNMSFGVGFNF